MLKVGVIIVNFNHGAYIRQAIQSVLAQTYGNFEIIIVDDGSTDNSRDIILELASEHPKIITHHFQENQGVSSARNKGVSLANQDLLAFLDADDLWLPEKLEKQASILQQYDQVGLCCSDFSNVTLDRAFNHFGSLKEMAEFRYENILTSDQTLQKLLVLNFVGTCTAILRKSVTRQAGLFNTDLKQAEDYDYWLKCAMHTAFYVHREPLALRRLHATNVTGNFLATSKFHKQVIVSYYQRNKAYMTTHGLLPYFQEGLSKINYLIGNLEFESGNKREAFRLYFHALRSQPTLRNFWTFCSTILKKSLRLLTLNLLSKKNFSS